MFRLKRFNHYLKLLIFLKGEKLIKSSIFFLLITVTISLLIFKNAGTWFTYIVVPSTNGITLFYIALQLSRGFKNLHHRSSFISEFSLPISSLERFIANVIFYFSFSVLLLAIVNFFLILGHYYLLSSSYLPFGKPTDFLVKYGTDYILYYLLLIFFFFFSGSIFFKSSFFKTLAIIAIIQLLLDRFSNQVIENSILIMAILFFLSSYFKLKKTALK